MKKTFFALATLLGLISNATAATPGEDNGLGIRLNVGFPGGDYSQKVTDYHGPKTITFDAFQPVNGVSFGLSLDNRWYVWHNNKLGAAIQARWLDANIMFGELANHKPFNDTKYADLTNIEGGILGVGPMFTFYLNNDMAIDAYYNIMPTYVYSMQTEDPDGEIFTQEFKYQGFGVTHHIGAAFRWKVLQAGLEYRIGTIGMEDVDNERHEMDASMNSFRVNLGVKF